GLACSRYSIQNPRQLGGGEVGVEAQARLFRELRLETRGGQFSALLRGAAILPDDRVVDRGARAAIPDDRGLALVGDSNRGDAVSNPAQPPQHGARARKNRGPDDLRVVLHPARGWVDRLEGLLLRRQDLARGREGHGTARARALIDGEEDVAHGWGCRSG